MEDDAKDVEDIPSDFFDDFNKDEFIEGLSIIDSWDDKNKNLKMKRSRKNNIDSVDYDKESPNKKSVHKNIRRSSSSSRLDDFIKPGSRRDPSKTNEAIKKDKEEKVKEFLAKSLEADDLRPPGTELDDYYDENKTAKNERTPPSEDPPLSKQPRSRSREYRPRRSPGKSFRPRESPPRQHRRKWTPSLSTLKRSNRRSPRRSPPRWYHQEPQRFHNFNKNFRPNFRQYSPSYQRRSPRRFSPRRSPRRSPVRVRRSRSPSPYKRSYESHHSRSPVSKNPHDSFLYPGDSDLSPNYNSKIHASPSPYKDIPTPYNIGEYSGPPAYTYAPPYSVDYNNSSYEYGGTHMASSGTNPAQVGPEHLMNSMPHTIPLPLPTPTVQPHPVPAPVMVPAPATESHNLMKMPISSHQADNKTPYDALAKLVAEGKISKEDYLKLAPNKGASSAMDTNQRVIVLNRCNGAIQSLGKLQLPNHLLINNHILDMGGEPKYIASKFCSPLKRQVPIEYLFTKANVAATARQNKHLVDSIIACIPDLDKIITRPKKKALKNMKDAAVQTSKPYCDVCEIRENTQFQDAGTSVDREDFQATVHTQVVEQDLISSKSVFNPSGSAGDGSAVSIAHLTPAQLVSQLAARAKTLKNSDTPANQYRRNPSNNYDYDGRGGQQYHNYSNYRY